MSISSDAAPGISGSLASALGLLAMAALVGWSLFYPPPAGPRSLRRRPMLPGAGPDRMNRRPMAAAMPSRRSCCAASTI